ncbi:MAG: hypothetical protein UT31_C0023G0006 [Parcubacteria group bacterium GW2011_GWF2_39_13b]|nr:MAG: hypothetical protein UT31_C0023G0006 [Parcubacteria group bacterium GW2011_GWF2_39_13b]
MKKFQQQFRRPELQNNGYPAISFYCLDPMCGKEDGHGLRIFRLTGIDMNICCKSLPVNDLAGLIDAGRSAYPPFGLVANEIQTELLIHLFSK